MADAAPPRLCGTDAWHGMLDDPAPRAVRWASRVNAVNEPVWSKWHYTEGNGLHTACGQPVILHLADGSPETSDLMDVTCARCLK